MRGPLAEPGEYTVKLTVGSWERTVPLVVEADPMLEISDADQNKRWESIKKLIPLQATSYSARKQASSLDRNIKDFKKSLSELPDISKDLRKRLDAVAEEVGKLASELNSLNSRITRIYSQITGSPFAPTVTQVRVLDELAPKLETLVSSLNQLITEKIPELNRVMNEEKIPRIKTGEPIKIKR
jgi:chromosome segregation ATPase